MRFALALVCAAGLIAQPPAPSFQHLATTFAGNLLFFSHNGKIYSFDGQASRPFAQQDAAALGWITASADGAVVAFNSLQSGDFQANLATGAGSIFWTTLGQAAISRNGRYALFTQTGGSTIVAGLRDGGGFSVVLDAPQPLAPGASAVASDGTAVLAGPLEIQIVRAGDVQIFPAADQPGSASIDDAAAVVAYDTPDSVVLLDLATGARTAFPGARPVLTADGRQVLYLGGDAQAWFAAVDGSASAPLTSDPAGIAEATISGNGSVAYAVTRDMRVLRIETLSGAVREITAAILPSAPADGASTTTAPPPAPDPVRIASFTNDPPFSSASATTVTLHWTTQNAVSVGVIGNGVPPGTLPVNGSVAVSPAANTTYTLIAYGANGRSASSVLYVFVR